MGCLGLLEWDDIPPRLPVYNFEKTGKYIVAPTVKD